MIYREHHSLTPGQFAERARLWLESTLSPDSDPVYPRDDVTEVVDNLSEQRALQEARDFQRALYQAGFAGITWPTECGGQGLSLEHQIAFDDAAAAFHLPTSGVFTIGHGMCGPTLLAHGSPHQQQRFIRPMLSGEELWCQMLSEPDAGSDLASLRTRAVKTGDGWMLQGHKLWTSGAHYCDFGLALVRTQADAKRQRGLSVFIVDLHAVGVSINPIRQLTGGARFNEIVLDDVLVSGSDLVGDLDVGWSVATTTLMHERVAIGAAARHHTSFRPLLRSAQVLGVSSDPLIRQELVKAWADETVLGLMGLRIRSAVVSGNEPGPEGSVAKLLNARLSKRCGDLGASMLGPRATAWVDGDPLAEPAVKRLLLAAGASIAGGTDEIQKTVIAERVLGLPRSPTHSLVPPTTGIQEIDRKA